jgi:hypothetical protein
VAAPDSGPVCTTNMQCHYNTIPVLPCGSKLWPQFYAARKSVADLFAIILNMGQEEAELFQKFQKSVSVNFLIKGNFIN